MIGAAATTGSFAKAPPSFNAVSVIAFLTSWLLPDGGLIVWD
jgi:hypothetical protein